MQQNGFASQTDTKGQSRIQSFKTALLLQIKTLMQRREFALNCQISEINALTVIYEVFLTTIIL